MTNTGADNYIAGSKSNRAIILGMLCSMGLFWAPLCLEIRHLAMPTTHEAYAQRGGDASHFQFAHQPVARI